TESSRSTLHAHVHISGVGFDVEPLHPCGLSGRTGAEDGEARTAAYIVHFDGDGAVRRIGEGPASVELIVKCVIGYAAPSDVSAEVKIVLPDSLRSHDLKTVGRSICADPDCTVRFDDHFVCIAAGAKEQIVVGCRRHNTADGVGSQLQLNVIARILEVE